MVLFNEGIFSTNTFVHVFVHGSKTEHIGLYLPCVEMGGTNLTIPVSIPGSGFEVPNDGHVIVQLRLLYGYDHVIQM